MPETLARRVVTGFTESGVTLATAESLTGGLLGATITSVSGASAMYRGGLITYATDLKQTLGGVTEEALRDHGAVSEATVRALASTAAMTCGADIGVALSGVAGPDEQEGHPVGTVWLGWALRDRRAEAGLDTGARLFHLDSGGGREAVREAAVEAALEQMVDLLGVRC